MLKDIPREINSDNKRCTSKKNFEFECKKYGDIGKEYLPKCLKLYSVNMAKAFYSKLGYGKRNKKTVNFTWG